ncbi:hypothetical protein BN1708_014945, partial [Verticillium longisporum]
SLRLFVTAGAAARRRGSAALSAAATTALTTESTTATTEITTTTSATEPRTTFTVAIATVAAGHLAEAIVRASLGLGRVARDVDPLLGDGGSAKVVTSVPLVASSIGGIVAGIGVAGNWSLGVLGGGTVDKSSVVASSDLRETGIGDRQVSARSRCSGRLGVTLSLELLGLRSPSNLRGLLHEGAINVKGALVAATNKGDHAAGGIVVANV